MSNSAMRTLLLVSFIPIGMLGVAFAAVPLYDLFCGVTGFGGTPLRAAEAYESDNDYGQIVIRFDGNVARDLGWSFKPEISSLTVDIGKTQTVFYQIENSSASTSTGVATFNVEPSDLAPFFVKIDCFCYEELTLVPRERIDSAVMFYIDPGLLSQERKSAELTLSYTFFPQNDK